MPAAARYATRPTPGAAHEVRRLAQIMDLAGAPLMPWQLQVARVACELHPSGVGWRWPTVVVTVPRQCGKSKLVAGVQLQRSIDHRAHLTWSTAQRLQDARERWKEVVEVITGEGSEGDKSSAALQNYLTRRLRGRTIKKGINSGAGSSAIYWANNSRVSPFTPGPQSGDGGKGDLLIFDEAFAFTREAGNEMLGSIEPATATRAWRQKWIVSTAGTIASTWLRDWVDRGRASIHDPESKVAYFEWSAPDNLDPYSPDTLALCHPALGITQTPETLAEFAAGPRSVWERAYLNRWVQTLQDTIIPLDLWASLTRAAPIPETGLSFALDVARDRSAATIAAAWRTTGEQVHAAIISTGAGSDWLAAALPQLAGRGEITADPTGPTLTLLDGLPADAGVRRLTTREYATACQSWFDRTHAQTASHTDASGLDGQLAAAALRTLGGLVALDPDKSAGPIDQLRALALATAAAAARPKEAQVF